jgi:hypothetical protein
LGCFKEAPQTNIGNKDFCDVDSEAKDDDASNINEDEPIIACTCK